MHEFLGFRIKLCLWLISLLALSCEGVQALSKAINKQAADSNFI
ncbi:hypothetical protein J577_3015 [Acinetobacter sp. 263903-1]|uniref:Uncharacterized protein n=1 Tax=Acinetobacter radioresistens SK82 TaxID=596318 RepID=A0ABM9YRL0_ACIRA|nr:hypothetical protein ACIRA0001_2554 [Acinetobacter radioresistens SK82]EXB33701.1 hypothetical protein J546_1475 [Acinetobacter sp. 1461402]EXB70079.1 hypothetical protein J550_2541 [Acinetobacter sp. 230853]EXE61131.1 hypothetical protein J579_0458 [Acinetobacter sp. 1239920]EXF56763.1 hypothetical protein J502_2066 [Acinetobacter sp. 1294596]KCX35448.1 hypothetical protein J577_3015 [Acinetobacter sp. 263903-1]